MQAMLLRLDIDQQETPRATFNLQHMALREPVARNNRRPLRNQEIGEQDPARETSHEEQQRSSEEGIRRKG
jgi:hypothetical protein